LGEKLENSRVEINSIYRHAEIKVPEINLAKLSVVVRTTRLLIHIDPSDSKSINNNSLKRIIRYKSKYRKYRNYYKSTRFT